LKIQFLEKIAEYYNEKYNLNTFIDICHKGISTYYSIKGNYIYFSQEYVKNLYNRQDFKKRIINLKEINQAYIFCILHEIYHAIDYKFNSNRYKQDLKNLNLLEYNTNRIYHNSLNFEIKADKFANKELKKWIRIFKKS